MFAANPSIALLGYKHLCLPLRKKLMIVEWHWILRAWQLKIIQTYARHSDSTTTIFCEHQKGCKEGKLKLGHERWVRIQKDKRDFSLRVQEVGSGITWAPWFEKGEWTDPVLIFCVTVARGKEVSSRICHWVEDPKNYTPYTPSRNILEGKKQNHLRNWVERCKSMWHSKEAWVQRMDREKDKVKNNGKEAHSPRGTGREANIKR